MKSILKTIGLFVTLLIFESCESFTEVDMPESQLTGITVFKNNSTANAALSDIYSRIREGGIASGNQIGVTYLMGNYSDDLQFYGNNANFEQFSKHTMVASNTYVSNLWTLTYGQIYAVNAMLQGLQASPISQENKERLQGEALFLRAYLHFYMVNLYGDVPYITTTDYKINSAVSRMTQAEVWQKIVSDLMLAENILPDTYITSDRVRPNKAVVKAMLARVYLYTKNWSDSEAYATEVIDNPLYILETDPAMVFLKDNPAIIWSLHPGIAGQNTRDAQTFIFSSGPPSKSALSEELYNAFESGDIRKNVWIKTITNGTNFWYHANKYKKNNNTGTSKEHTILFRMAEQYLIRAEARARTGNILGAQQDLNKIRTRSGLHETTANSIQDLIVAIMNERRVELFAEQGHRWFDLKRNGMANTVLSGLKPGWKDTDLLLPLPENEIVLNSNLLPQNPGY